MNYRHDYHAGSFADVFKHCLLLALIDRFRKKPKPFTVLDTHAGTGVYDLDSLYSKKTLEYQQGISKLITVPLKPAQTLIQEYLDIIQTVNHSATGALQYYPGSPLLIAHALRPQDKLIACELHPDIYPNLKQLFKRHLQVALHYRDGYEALKALLPFKTQRGLVLIDPPFEDPKEFSHLYQAIVLSLTKFNGTIVIWYPIKDAALTSRFYRRLKSAHPHLCCIEAIRLDPPTTMSQLQACGMIVINPPWQFLQVLRSVVLPVLASSLRLSFKISGEAT